MSIRVTRVPIVVAACLTWLCACSTAPKLGDLSSSQDKDGETSSAPATDGGGTGILGDLWASKSKDKAAANAAAADGSETTGSVVTQPAEPGQSGEPVAPLSRPGLVGDDPNDDVQLGKKYFRSNNFGLAEQKFRSAVEKHPSDAEAWLGLAASYDRLRRFDLADRAYAQVLRLIGPTAVVLNDEGFSFMLRGDYARAHKLLEQAQAKDPGNPYVQANMQLLNDSYHDRKSVQ